MSVTLGSVAFQGMEIPEEIPFSGPHLLARHQLIGGNRVFDALPELERSIGCPPALRPVSRPGFASPSAGTAGDFRRHITGTTMRRSNGIAGPAEALRLAAEAIEAAAAVLASPPPARSFAPWAGACFMRVSPPADPAHIARVQVLAEDPVLRERVYLLAAGVPFDVAFELDAVNRAAWCAVIREHRSEPVLAGSVTTA